MRKCFICGEEKEKVSLEYGKPICESCLPEFEEEAKREVEGSVEDLF